MVECGFILSTGVMAITTSDRTYIGRCVSLDLTISRWGSILMPPSCYAQGVKDIFARNSSRATTVMRIVLKVVIWRPMAMVAAVVVMCWPSWRGPRKLGQTTTVGYSWVCWGGGGCSIPCDHSGQNYENRSECNVIIGVNSKIGSLLSTMIWWNTVCIVSAWFIVFILLLVLRFPVYFFAVAAFSFFSDAFLKRSSFFFLFACSSSLTCSV